MRVGGSRLRSPRRLAPRYQKPLAGHSRASSDPFVDVRAPRGLPACRLALILDKFRSSWDVKFTLNQDSIPPQRPHSRRGCCPMRRHDRLASAVLALTFTGLAGVSSQSIAAPPKITEIAPKGSQRGV